MQAIKEPVQVSILNQTFPVHTDAPDEHVKRVAQLVTKKVEEIQSHSKKASSLHVALLACLNIADELLRFKEDKASAQSRAAQKLSDVIEIIDLQL